MRSDFSLKKTTLTRTLAGAELVEVVTREMKLSPEQVTSMGGNLLQVFRGGNVSPSLYVYKVDRNMN